MAAAQSNKSFSNEPLFLYQRGSAQNMEMIIQNYSLQFISNDQSPLIYWPYYLINSQE
ncbi:12246_t:CDS:1, partial [Funneliformis caledonium]